MGCSARLRANCEVDCGANVACLRGRRGDLRGWGSCRRERRPRSFGRVSADVGDVEEGEYSEKSHAGVDSAQGFGVDPVAAGVLVLAKICSAHCAQGPQDGLRKIRLSAGGHVLKRRQLTLFDRIEECQHYANA